MFEGGGEGGEGMRKCTNDEDKLMFFKNKKKGLRNRFVCLNHPARYRIIHWSLEFKFSVLRKTYYICVIVELFIKTDRKNSFKNSFSFLVSVNKKVEVDTLYLFLISLKFYRYFQIP